MTAVAYSPFKPRRSPAYVPYKSGRKKARRCHNRGSKGECAPKRSSRCQWIETHRVCRSKVPPKSAYRDFRP